MEAEAVSEKQFNAVALSDLNSLAEEIYSFGKSYKIWLLDAPMGAGKTTFITALCKFLEVNDHVSSPTFALVNEYASEKVGEVYHFDFYRIESEEEALDIGAEDYFYSGNLCLIEWPGMIPSLLPDTYLSINISVSQNGESRDFTVRKNG